MARVLRASRYHEGLSDEDWGVAFAVADLSLDRAVRSARAATRTWRGKPSAEWLKRGEDRPTLAFCVDRKHAQHVHERFEEVGVPSEYMDGLTAREDREATFVKRQARQERFAGMKRAEKP